MADYGRNRGEGDTQTALGSVKMGSENAPVLVPVTASRRTILMSLSARRVNLGRQRLCWFELSCVAFPIER